MAETLFTPRMVVRGQPMQFVRHLREFVISNPNENPPHSRSITFSKPLSSKECTIMLT